MTALPFVPGVVKSVVNCRLVGANINNIVYWNNGVGTPWTQAQITAVTNQMSNSMTARFTGNLSNQVTMVGVKSVDLTNATGVVAAAANGGTGTKFGTPAPSSAALVISWPLALHYRGGRPRTYVGGLASGDQSTANTWNPVVVTAWINAWNGLVADVISAAGVPAALTHCSVAYRRNNVRLAVPIVTGLGVGVSDGGIDSQRRRLGKS